MPSYEPAMPSYEELAVLVAEQAVQLAEQAVLGLLGLPPTEGPPRCIEAEGSTASPGEETHR